MSAFLSRCDFVSYLLVPTSVGREGGARLATRNVGYVRSCCVFGAQGTQSFLFFPLWQRTQHTAVQ